MRGNYKMKNMNWQEFKEYLKKLDGKKPFNCPLLKVLPEEVTMNVIGQHYQAGDLICSGTVGFTGGSSPPYDHKCYLEKTAVVFGEAGGLEVHCGWNGSTFNLILKGFKPAYK